MGATGDFSKLRALIGSMKKLKRTGVKRVTNQLAIEAEQLVHECFEQSRDVNGVPFAPITHRAGLPLMDTRRLDNSITHQLIGSGGFRLFTSVKYAGVQNQGGIIRAKNGGYLHFRVGGGWVKVRQVTIKRRQFMPSPGQLPGPWETRLRAVAQVAMLEAMR